VIGTLVRLVYTVEPKKLLALKARVPPTAAKGPEWKLKGKE
jgi:hypothetical protein